MDSGTGTAWWRQLAGMYQGLLFLEGHIFSAGAAGGEDGVRRAAVPAGAGSSRHPGAASRLAARRLRAGATLSLFR